MRSIATGTDAFALALEQLKGADVRSEFAVDEAPAPQRLAPCAVALTAEMSDVDSDAASGRFVLLHDPDESVQTAALRAAAQVGDARLVPKLIAVKRSSQRR